jgi:hypothetical protein
VTPQSPFTVMAPIAAGREAALREFLRTMNSQPGVADPRNAVLPFGEFENLHFARLAVLTDATMADLETYGVPRPKLPTYLSFFGDCDGSARDFLTELSQRADRGLRQIFSHCEGFDPAGDLLAWMLAHDQPVAANYVNWVGGTVRQVNEEHALQRALAARVSREPLSAGDGALQRRRELIAFVDDEVRAGRLTLSPPQPTPPGWKLKNIVHAIGVPLIGLIALPFLVVLLPFLIVMLRMRETSDPEVCPRPSAAAVKAMQELEDHDVTNQFTAIGPVKPGLFRRWLLTALLAATDYACRHVYTSGHLTRVQTIHFARWAFADDKARVLFASNYDGGHEAYMDDFINKVGWGLNILFSNGFGWPRTDWLILGGSRREQLFKHYQRGHQLPTQVWYNACPGLTVANRIHNRRIREGLERADMSESEALAWLRLL